MASGAARPLRPVLAEDYPFPMRTRTSSSRTPRRTYPGATSALVALGVAGAVLAPGSPALASNHLPGAVDPAPPCTAGVPAADFVDREAVPPLHRASVDCLALYTVTTGSGDPADPVFRPLDTLTRGQMASFLARGIEASGFALPEATAGFVDIAGSVHADAISSLAAQGIVTGRTADRFAPDEPVRRDQAASMLLRAVAAVRGVDAATLLREHGPFTDVAGTVHRPAVNGARELGLVTGVTATTYQPGAPLTRAQMASLVRRWLDRGAPATASCTNPEDAYSLRHPAEWAVNDGSVLPTCSVLDRAEVELPPASEIPLGLDVVVGDLDVTFEEARNPGPEATVVTQRDLTVDGRPAVRQELVATGDGLIDAGVRWTRYLVDRGDRALQAATYDVPGNHYATARGVLTRMVLSLDLTGTGLPPFLPPTAVTAQEGDAVDLDLSAVRTAHHERDGYAYDRVVLEFTGSGTAGWSVAQWQDEAVLDGSGAVVPVDGDAVLALAVTGQVTPPQPPFEGLSRFPGPGLPVQEVVTGSVFEAHLDAFLGTAAPAPYRVFRVGAPERVVVDVLSNAG